MYIAIDVGGTKINISSFSKLTPDSGESEVIIKTTTNFTKDIENIKKVLQKHNKIKAISFALPGFIVDENRGIVSAANLPGWENKDIKKSLKSIIDAKHIFLAHDAKAHALAELIFAKTSNPFVYIAWGTGIGATYIKKVGKLIHSQQIEFGYQTVKGVHIEKLVGGINFKDRFGKQASNMSEADWGKVVEDMSTGVANLYALNYAPQFIWGGGVAVKQAKRLPEIMKRASKKYPYWPTPKHRLSTFNERGGTVGALANIKYHLNS